MAWMLKGVLICLLLLMVFSTSTVCMDAEIVTSPENVTVFVDNEAQFRCVTSNVAIVDWIVNGTFFRLLNTSLHVGLDPRHERVGDYDVNTLTIKSKAEYNGTTVQCVGVLIGGGLMETENATLMIQGVLAPVGDVSVESGSDSILLSWSSPFSLNVTGVDPDIWYTVLISNVTDEDNPTAVPCTDCHNLTQPNYTFTTANPSPCHKYSFTVIPQNGAGEGNRSEPVEGAFVEETNMFDVSEVKPVVIFWNHAVFTVSLDLQLVGSASVCRYSFVVYIFNARKRTLYATELLPLLSGFRLEFNVSTVDSGLDYDSKYQMIIEGGNETERSNTSKAFPLSTFDVQTVDVIASDGMLTVMKKLIVNSPAQGCFLIFKSQSPSPDRMMAVLNTSTPAVVTGLEPNIYDILVYDVEENGLPNEKPAVQIKDKDITKGGMMETQNKELFVLQNVAINTNNDQVNITCHFNNDSFLSSQCVIVICKSTEVMLMIENYTRSMGFPVTLNISEPGSYTVAVFGWSEGIIESFPTELQQVDITDISQDVKSTSIPIVSAMPTAKSKLQLNLVPILASCIPLGAILVLIVMVIGVVLASKCWRRNLRKIIIRTDPEEKAHMDTYTALAAESLEAPVAVPENMQENTRSMFDSSQGVAATSPFITQSDSAEQGEMEQGNTSAYQNISLQTAKAQPNELKYVEVDLAHEGLPSGPPVHGSTTEYSTVFPHTNTSVKSYEMAEQESLDSSGQGSAVVTSSHGWTLDSSDGDGGPRTLPELSEKEGCKSRPLREQYNALHNNRDCIGTDCSFESPEERRALMFPQCKTGCMVTGYTSKVSSTLRKRG